MPPFDPERWLEAAAAAGMMVALAEVRGRPALIVAHGRAEPAEFGPLEEAIAMPGPASAVFRHLRQAAA